MNLFNHVRFLFFLELVISQTIMDMVRKITNDIFFKQVKIDKFEDSDCDSSLLASTEEFLTKNECLNNSIRKMHLKILEKNTSALQEFEIKEFKDFVRINLILIIQGSLARSNNNVAYLKFKISDIPDLEKHNTLQETFTKMIEAIEAIPNYSLIFPLHFFMYFKAGTKFTTEELKERVSWGNCVYKPHGVMYINGNDWVYIVFQGNAITFKSNCDRISVKDVEKWDVGFVVMRSCFFETLSDLN